MLTNEQKEQIDNMDYEDRRQLAMSTDNIDILEYLSSDEHWNIRSHVAENAHTPTDILNKLSKDVRMAVRTSVAYNIHTPIDILNKLSNDEDSDVRHILIWNENTPMCMLVKLSNDRWWYVREAAMKQIEKRKYESSLINIDKFTIKGILE